MHLLDILCRVMDLFSDEGIATQGRDSTRVKQRVTTRELLARCVTR